MTKEYDILITGGKVLPLAEGDEIISSGYVGISDGVIEDIGAMSAMPQDASARQGIDAKGCLVMPGLVNTHTHAAMTLFRGLADDLPLMTWLEQHIFPAEARFVNEDMVYWCSKLAAAEMLLSGTTTVADGYFHENSAALAFSEAGMRAVAAQGVVGFPAPGVPDPAANIKTAEEYLAKWHGKDDLVTPAVFCHAPYTCGPDTLKEAKQLTKSYGLPFCIHLAETREEVEQIKERHGVSPVRYLADLGVLDEKTIGVHCVWLSDDDIGILQQTNTKIAICPESNMKLASGVAPVAELADKGVVLGLGTDGCASNNNLDMFGEMDACAKLQKVSLNDPTALPAPFLLMMATRGGAQVLGLGDRIGGLSPGKRADLIVIDTNQPHLTPFYSADLLVYSCPSGDVVTTIVDGRVVMQDRRILTFDVDEAIRKVNELSRVLRKTI